jgi:glycine cleavage system aminomethyltransferase T
MSTAIRRSPAARLSSRGGAVFVEEAGWEIPASYGNDAEERAAIRDRVAIADVTARAKVDIRGRIPETLPSPADTVLARISAEWVVLLGAPDAERRLIGAIEPVVAPGAMVTDVTHLFAGVALAGPALPELVERATSWDLSTLPLGAATGAPIAEVRALLVRREFPFPVLEVFVAMEFGRYVWETLSGIVSGLGGGPAGWQALRAEGWR